jgi:hypothetical protein
MDAGEVAELEAQLGKVTNELGLVELRLAKRLGPIERQELNVKKAELESEMVGLRNQIRLASEKLPPG